MARLITIPDMQEGYISLVRLVRELGREVPSRNGPTLELEDVIIEVPDPTNVLPLGINRGYNLALAAAEGAQLVAGVSYPQLMTRIAPNTAQFLDDGEFHGAYGPRTRAQMPVIARRLAQDLDSRQAVVTLWSPELDLPGGKRDHPCTIMFDFLVRDGRLNMKTVMRSQDIFWGTSYDLAMFTTLQLTLANVLRVPAGTYTHHSISLHLYLKDVPAVEKLTPPESPAGERVRGFTGDSWEEVASRARLALGGHPRDAAGAWTWRHVERRLERT